MVTPEVLAARKAALGGSPDLRGLLAHVAARNAPVVRQRPSIPDVKALLSADGGVCPVDSSPLVFDPWSPDQHRCPKCGKVYSGERHHRSWARFQHLWLAERAVELAALDALGDQVEAGARAAELLRSYGERYFRYPNRDNVLGPSRLFFSTYLESIWVLNFLGAAALLRAAGRLDEATARAVHIVAEEAANLIGEFDEGFSNRQTWNNAALTAIAVWFEDEDLARRAIEGRTGLVQHLRGYREDGMWYEGENYHLFALRGLLIGAQWAAQAGLDFFADDALAARVVRALEAPIVTALPDLTFPARKDSRFGVSLSQPMYVELWEAGVGETGRGERGAGGTLAAWLRALYAASPVGREVFESYLHDAPLSPLPSPVSRTGLSWWALLYMPPTLGPEGEPWVPKSALLADQGLAVLRAGNRYASLECGRYGGGHGHPDRLHLTLHADGVHWLADPGTGSYVSPLLAWYRSTLAHNAPRLDGVSQAPGDATCEAFFAGEQWSWMRGRFGDLVRTVVMGPTYLVDLVEFSGREERTLELPWHLAGRAEARAPGGGGRWEPADLADAFATGAERIVLEARGDGGEAILLDSGVSGAELAVRLLFSGGGSLLRALGPGLPGTTDRRPFFLQRARARNVRFIAVVEFGAAGSAVREVVARGDAIEVRTPTGSDRHQPSDRGWTVVTGSTRVTLGGVRTPEPTADVLFNLERPTRPTGEAARVVAPPPLDGTVAGFDTHTSLPLDLEDQYRRSEEPYSGPEDFRAVAHAGWDDAALYLAVDVMKANLCFRPGDAPPLRLDNEPDDIHSDGIQFYLAADGVGGGAAGRQPLTGFLVVPDPRGTGLRVRTVSDATGDAAAVHGSWRRTDHGYCITLAVPWPQDLLAHSERAVAFDLIVNEMLPDRERRAGQLVWSGGGGWVWLQGDRQDVERLGVLELVG